MVSDRAILGSYSLIDAAIKVLLFTKSLFFTFSVCRGVKVYTNKLYSSVEVSWAFFNYYAKFFPEFAVHSLGCVQQGTATKFLEQCIELYMDCLTQINIPGVH